MRLSPHTARIRPPALRPGDRVGIIAPASQIEPDLLEAGCARLRDLGYEPVYDDSILDRDLYFAGSVQRRARELERMFAREDVRAVLCARGGYGANYLLTEVDATLVRGHPKIFLGYSDITTLHTYFSDVANLVTFHGPMVTKDFAQPDGVDLASFEAAVRGTSDWWIGEGSGMRTLAPGNAEGILYGGCLSMLVASLGTPFEVDTRGTLLFLEDIGAKPYQVDRMLMQLKLAGKFTEVRGLIFGAMLDCVQPGGQDYTLDEVVLRVVRDLGVPVAYGLRSGHVTRANITLPLGVRAALEAGDQACLHILEPAVSLAGVARP